MISSLGTCTLRRQYSNVAGNLLVGCIRNSESGNGFSRLIIENNEHEEKYSSGGVV